jgi:hypothetical protein
MRLRRGPQGIVVGALLALSVVLLGACGPPDPAAGSAAAANACEELVGVEDTLLKGQVSPTVAIQALNTARTDADHAASDDPRWKRLDADVTAVRLDLVSGHTATLRAKATDAAAICSPLSVSPTTTP